MGREPSWTEPGLSWLCCQCLTWAFENCAEAAFCIHNRTAWMPSLFLQGLPRAIRVVLVAMLTGKLIHKLPLFETSRTWS